MTATEKMLIEALQKCIAQAGAPEAAQGCRLVIATAKEALAAVDAARPVWAEAPDRLPEWSVDEFAIVNDRRCEVWRWTPTGSVSWQVLDGSSARGSCLGHGFASSADAAKDAAEDMARNAR